MKQLLLILAIAISISACCGPPGRPGGRSGGHFQAEENSHVQMQLSRVTGE